MWLDELKPASKAWLSLGILVVAYDAWAIAKHKETMSMAFSNAMSHPIKRWPTVLGSTLVYTHLILPQKYHKYDPIRIIGGVIFGNE